MSQPDSSSQPKCPACDADMVLTSWGDIYGFECGGCRGHLIRTNALQAFLTRHTQAQAFLEHLERVRGATPSRRKLQCPDCETGRYHAVESSAGKVDACGGCGGLFLDAGEAAPFLDESRSAPPPQRHPKTFAERQRRQEEMNDRILQLMNDIF